MPSSGANKGLHQIEGLIDQLEDKLERGLIDREDSVDLRATIAQIRATKKRFRKLVPPPEVDLRLYNRISSRLDRLLENIKSSSKVDHPDTGSDPGARGFVMFNEIMNRMGAVY